MKQQVTQFNEAVEYRLAGSARVRLGSGPGFSGRCARGEFNGDPRTPTQRLRDQVARLRMASSRVIDQARPMAGGSEALREALDILDAEISRIDAETAN